MHDPEYFDRYYAETNYARGRRVLRAFQDAVEDRLGRCLFLMLAFPVILIGFVARRFEKKQ